MGYMPDFFGVYDRLKSWEYLDFYARCYGFGPKERRRMTDSLLELVNLSDKRDSYVDVLSRGMKQRLFWRARSSTTRACSFWTSPPPAWTRAPARR